MGGMMRSTQRRSLRLDPADARASLCRGHRRLSADRHLHPVLHRCVPEADDELGRLGELFEDLNATFAEVIIRTFVWTFFSVSIKMIIGTFGASMLNAAVPGRALFRVLTMPPWIVPMAIGIFMWGWMYNASSA